MYQIKLKCIVHISDYSKSIVKMCTSSITTFRVICLYVYVNTYIILIVHGLLTYITLALLHITLANYIPDNITDIIYGHSHGRPKL